MEKKRKYLGVLTLISLVWGTAAFSSYADTDKKKDGKDSNKEKTEKVVKVVKVLKKVKSEEGKFTGEVTFEGVHNVGIVSYPARTDFMPSLIVPNKSHQDASALVLDVTVKMGASKKFFFEDETFDGKLELKATKTEVKLSQIYLTWNEWMFGITKNNFCNIATFPAAKVTQLSWKKRINEMFTVNIGVEEAKEFSFFGKDDAGKLKATATENKDFKPRKQLPAASARIEYNLPNELGTAEISGLYRPLGWVSEDGKKTGLQPGLGVNLGGKINVKPETDILTAHLLFGQGIGEYIGDLASLESEPISIYIDKKAAKSIMVGGAYATYEHHWTPSLRSTIGGGLTTILNDHKKEEKEKQGLYKLGVYGTGNLVYWFTEHTSVGVEYGTGYRENVDDKKQTSKGANHIKATFEFKL